MQNILITGANGFIGSNLCRYFLKNDCRVYGLVRETSDLHFLEDLDVQLIYGDLCEAGKIDLPKNLDVIIHCASVVSDQADKGCCEINIYDNTIAFVQHIMESQIQLKKFIYISSALVLGYKKLHISEENPGIPASNLPYVKYKKKTEEYLLSMHQKHKFPVVILRPADVYGPYDRTSCVHILKGIEDGVPIIVSHGKWILPFCYVDNLSLATYLACKTENIDGQAYTITNDLDVTWKEFFAHLTKRLNRKQRVHIPVFVPYLIAFGMKIIRLIIPSFEPTLTFYRARRVTSDTNYDISKTIKDLHYVPDKNLEEQFNAIVDWYISDKRSGRNK